METTLALLLVAVPMLIGALLCCIAGHFGVFLRTATTLSTVTLMCGSFTYAKILMGWSTGLSTLAALGSGVLATMIFIASYGFGFATKGPRSAK